MTKFEPVLQVEKIAEILSSHFEVISQIFKPNRWEISKESKIWTP